MTDLSLIPEAAWVEAQRRADVVRPLAARDRQPRHLVRAAAASLGLSERRPTRCCAGAAKLRAH